METNFNIGSLKIVSNPLMEYFKKIHKNISDNIQLVQEQKVPVNFESIEILKKVNGSIQLKYLLDAYKLFPGKDSFFLKNNFINRLAGNDALQQQVKQNKTEAEIKQSWQPALNNFKIIRKKYLLYKDFKPAG